MKKILLSSLLAVMAVTSANAKIASTGYVDAAEAAAEAAANTYTDEKIGALDATTNGDGDFVIGVAQTDGVVTVTKGEIAYSDLAGKPTVDTEMKADSTNAVQNKVIKSYVDTAIDGVNGDIAAITSATVAEEGKEDGQYVLTKKVVDGVITYSWESIDRTLAN